MKTIITTLLLFLYCAVCLAQNTENDTLKIGYKNAPPFIIESDQELKGVNVWLWKQVAKDLKLNYKFVNMNFSQMIDSISNNKLDVIINPLTITSERSKKFKFTDSFFASNSTIAVSKISAFSKFKNTIKGFFNLAFLEGLFVLILIIFIFGFIGWRFERKNNSKKFRRSFRGLWDGVWWSAVTLTTVGYGDKIPKSKGGKITAFVLMFSGLLFISGLTASISSNLTVNQLTNNPETFNEFKALKVGTNKKSSTEHFLKTHFFKNIKPYKNIKEGLKSLSKNEIDAFVYDEPILKYYIREDSSLQKLSTLPIRFDVQFYAFGLSKKNAVLEEVISQKILEITETQKWQVLLSEFGLTEF